MAIKYQFDYRCYNTTMDQVEYLKFNDNIEQNVRYITQVFKNNEEFNFN